VITLDPLLLLLLYAAFTPIALLHSGRKTPDSIPAGDGEAEAGVVAKEWGGRRRVGGLRGDVLNKAVGGDEDRGGEEE
jgi:hypothetical protein